MFIFSLNLQQNFSSLKTNKNMDINQRLTYENRAIKEHMIHGNMTSIEQQTNKKRGH